ncbi:hypothetical protein E24_00217 [Faustovirus]|nr:hypothetical protein E24_00217 [Faustovirus]AMN84125.1 hypothetical protein D5a_00215 [Faustovirus]AMN85114.1 hypothetical protein E23_00216 [Faustovirus]
MSIDADPIAPDHANTIIAGAFNIYGYAIANTHNITALKNAQTMYSNSCILVV